MRFALIKSDQHTAVVDKIADGLSIVIGWRFTMSKDLTTSQIDRQNILNNNVALGEIQKAINIKCIVWNEKLYLTKDMVASFFDVDIRTIERYINKFGAELANNGYLVLKGKNLQDFLNVYEENFATDINVGHKIRALSKSLE